VPVLVQVSEPATPKKPARRGRIAVVVSAVLLVGAVVAGTGYTVVTVNGADRDAGAPIWKFPKARKGSTATAPADGLAGVLVPYGSDGWERGPDIGEFGSDAELSGARATALRKESLRELPRTQRRRLAKEIDRQPVKGMAMRSYVSTDGVYLPSEKTVTVSITLTRMQSRAAVRDRVRFHREFVDALGVFRKGPAIKGHKDALCVLPPKDDDADLDAMTCSAYVGDVLVAASATGLYPLDTKSVATLLSEQLDRIAEPGEAV
jgi:hypothetical protein